jgi:hypothetical protein
MRFGNLKRYIAYIVSQIVLSSNFIYAMEQTQEIVRQPRNMAMGGIGVGLADDEYSLFNNPAGLAGYEQRGFRPLGFGIEGTWDTYKNFSEIASVSKSLSFSSMNIFMNKDISFRMSQVPMVLLPHFALSYIADTQVSVNQFNQVSPYFNLGAMITHGVQAGMAWSFKEGRRSTSEFRYGLAVKLLFRKGGYYDLGTANMLHMSGEAQSYLANIIGGYGKAFGGDLGAQYLKKIEGNSTISLGASITDIAGTKFPDSRTMSIPMSLNVGAGLTKNLYESKLKFGLDFRNLLLSNSLSNKIHLGSEFDMGYLKLMAGLNQLHATYGVGFDFWMLKTMFMSYAEELGPSYGLMSSRRMLVQVNFNMPI